MRFLSVPFIFLLHVPSLWFQISFYFLSFILLSCSFHFLSFAFYFLSFSCYLNFGYFHFLFMCDFYIHFISFSCSFCFLSFYWHVLLIFSAGSLALLIFRYFPFIYFVFLLFPFIAFCCSCNFVYVHVVSF